MKNEIKRDIQGRFESKVEDERHYGWLLEYNEIHDWINDYTSENTRETYLRAMSNFFKEIKVTPDVFVTFQGKKIKSLYRRTKQKYIQEDKSSMALQLLKVLKSFLEAHEKDIVFTRKDRVKSVPKRVKKQRIPTKEEIYQMADSSKSLRSKALILCLFQSGVRINCIMRWKYFMVKDRLEPLKVPIPLRITNDIDTKLGNIGYYYSFLQDEASLSLKIYLDYRMKVQHWIPENSDLVFVSTGKYEDGTRKSINKNTVRESVKTAAKNIGLEAGRIWTHLLRKAFRKVLYKAPIDNDLCEAIMGHRIAGSKDNYFDRHDLEFIASEYMKAPFSREGIGKLNHLEKENIELKSELDKTKEILERIREEIDGIKKSMEKS